MTGASPPPTNERPIGAAASRRHRLPAIVTALAVLAIGAAAAVLVGEQVRDATRRTSAAEGALVGEVVQSLLGSDRVTGEALGEADTLLTGLGVSLTDASGSHVAGVQPDPTALDLLPAETLAEASGDLVLHEAEGVLHAGLLVARTADGGDLLLRYRWDTSERDAGARRAGAVVLVAALLVAVALGAALVPTVRSMRRGLEERSRSLKTLLERERATVEKLNQVDVMKTGFLTAISHELRTPLTVITGFAQVLQERASDLEPRQIEQFATRLLAKSERLDQLLGDLLDIDRLARGVLEPTRRSIDVTELVRSTIERMQLQGHPVTLPDAAVSARVDPAHVERIIENLIRNADKYTPDGTPIEVRVWREDTELALVVLDRGPGISDADKVRVFDALTRVDDDHPNPGIGTGLALVARLAELHGGAAWAADTLGGGLEVHVRLDA